MPQALKIPISAIAKLSKHVSRPTLYKIVETRKDIVKQLIEKEKELTKFYDSLFIDYKKGVYQNRTVVKRAKASKGALAAKAK